MKNEAIVFEIVNRDTGRRHFHVDDPGMPRRLAERLDREGVRYAIYRARVAPLSHKRWAKFMSMLCNERRDQVPFFHNGELLVSSDQSLRERMRYWGDGECHLEVVGGI